MTAHLKSLSVQKIFNDTLIFMSLNVNNQKREEIILKNDINNISFNFNTETKSTWAEILLKMVVKYYVKAQNCCLIHLYGL